MCGRAINVCDVRSKEANPCASIADAHVGAVNYLRWSPASENLILSSGADDAIQVTAPFLGRCPCSDGRRVTCRAPTVFSEQRPWRWLKKCGLERNGRQVYDIRSSRMPVMTFRGHNMRKGSHIYQPLWGDGGNCVISGVCQLRYGRGLFSDLLAGGAGDRTSAGRTDPPPTHPRTPHQHHTHTALIGTPRRIHQDSGLDCAMPCLQAETSSHAFGSPYVARRFLPPPHDELGETYMSC